MEFSKEFVLMFEKYLSIQLFLSSQWPKIHSTWFWQKLFHSTNGLLDQVVFLFWNIIKCCWVRLCALGLVVLVSCIVPLLSQCLISLPVLNGIISVAFYEYTHLSVWCFSAASRWITAMFSCWDCRLKYLISLLLGYLSKMWSFLRCKHIHTYIYFVYTKKVLFWASTEVKNWSSTLRLLQHEEWCVQFSRSWNDCTNMLKAEYVYGK